MKKLLTVLCAGALLLPSVLPAAAVDRSAPVRDSVAVEKINFQNPAFLRGMDVSSVISLEDAGVTFRDERGEEQDLFKILADNGVNAVRVRIWYDPYDSEGHGYGGGNSDLDKAKQIGRRAAAYGMKLLADFHYSDFWADPAKQKEPKAWAGLSAAQKAETIYTYTNDSLKELRAAGADLCMVQIGNEITSGVAGCMDNADRAALLCAASRAVRDFDSEVMIACHFTDPQKTDTIKWFADYLHQYGVDYDVFATSYYPSWHGSLSNLTHVLSYAAETYGKYAMVAETSYPYTLEDSDGHANTVSFWNNNTGDDMRWDFSPPVRTTPSPSRGRLTRCAPWRTPSTAFPTAGDSACSTGRARGSRSAISRARPAARGRGSITPTARSGSNTAAGGRRPTRRNTTPTTRDSTAAAARWTIRRFSTPRVRRCPRCMCSKMF